MIAATEEVVHAKIISSGCKRRPDRDTVGAYCFEDPDKKIFFITRLVDGVGYTVEHLEAIEDSLRNRAVDLFPLDPNLVNYH